MDTKTAILAAGGGQTYFYFNGINCLFARMVYNLGMKERNYGIDFLRLVSMLFVVILHTLLISKLLVCDGESGEVHMSAWLLETLCYGAVDIFALISGYVGFREKEKPFKWRRIFSLWFQAVFYGLLIFLIYLVVKPDVASRSALYASLMPISHRSYWYLTAFMALSLVMPILNAGVREMDKKTLKRSVWVALVTFSVLSLLSGDMFKLEGGYSFVWLAVLYFIGAAMRKADIFGNMRRFWCLIGYFVCSLAAWAIKIWGVDLRAAGLSVSHASFVNYTSPLIVLASMFLVAYFSRLKIGRRPARLIACFVPCAFAVYIINCNTLIWGSFLPNALGGIKRSGLGLAEILVGVFAFSISFFIISLLVEKVRLFAAQRITRKIRTLYKK